MKKRTKFTPDKKAYEIILKQTAKMCENYRATYQINEAAMEKLLDESIQKQTQSLPQSMSFLYTTKNHKRP